MFTNFASFLLFPLLITKIGGTKKDIGMLMGVLFLTSVLSRPWISEILDRVGRKRSYTIGCIITVFIPLAYIFFQNDLSSVFWPIFIIRLVHGIVVSLSFTAVFTLATDIIPNDRLSEGVGVFGITALLGLAVGPLIAETIIQRFGFSYMFVTASLLGLFAFVFHLPLKDSYVPDQQARRISFFSILAEQRTISISAIVILFGVVLAAYGSFVVPYVKSVGISKASPYFIYYSLAAIFARLWGGKLTDRVGEERVIPYALLITGSGMLAMIFLSGSGTLRCFGFITGFGHGLLTPALFSLLLRDSHPAIRGKLNGIFTGSIDSGAFVGGVLMGYIGDWLGFPAIFIFAGLAVLMGIFLLKWCVINRNNA